MDLKLFNILKFLFNLFKTKNKLYPSEKQNNITINFDEIDLMHFSLHEINIRTIQLSELQRRGLTTAGRIPKVVKDTCPPPPPETKWEIEKA